eukprot:4515737-Prymnesium_polylepis.1
MPARSAWIVAAASAPVTVVPIFRHAAASAVTSPASMARVTKPCVRHAAASAAVPSPGAATLAHGR